MCGVTERTISGNAETNVEDFKYSKEDICSICEVTSKTFERFVGATSMSERDFIIVGSSHKKLYNEDVLKKFQLYLMKNQVNQGVQVETVKETGKTVFQLGTLANVALTSGNIEAAEQFSKLLIQATTATAQAKELEAQNKQLQLEVDKYVQWMSASQIKKEYNLPARPGVTKVAQLLGLKRGEDWIEKNYGDDTCYSKVLYSPEAVQLIVAWYFED